MIESLFETILDVVLGLRGGVAYLVIGALAWAEAAFFLGLITPGEIAMALGGVLASRDQVDLVIMIAVAGGGTVLGNSTGYWLGRLWGTRILNWDRLQGLLGSQIERTEDYFQRKGGHAIVLGRFASFLRIFVPFVAGAAKMPYPRFLAYDVPTGVAWTAVWVVAGFILGQSWHVLRDVTGPAAFLVLTLVVLALLLRWAAGKISEKREEIGALVQRLQDTPPIRWLLRRYGDQLRWLGHRLNPRVARGLNLTIAFFVFLAGIAVVGLVMNELLWFQTLARVDLRILRWFTATRTDAAVAVSAVIATLFVPPWVVVPVVGAAAYGVWRRGWQAGLRVLIGVVGATGGAMLLNAIADPGIRGTQFPSVPVATVTAFVAHIVAVEGSRLAWARTVALGAVGIFVIAVVALATLVLSTAAPTGIVFAVAAALTWSAAIELQARVLPGPPTDDT